MNSGFLTVSTKDIPILATAIHNGHDLRDEVREIMKLDDDTRLREEDPYTGQLAEVIGNYAVVNRSRFEVDVNRPKEKAIYLKPYDAWGLNIWEETPTPDIISRSLEQYDTFYSVMKQTLDEIKDRHGKFVVYDVHSYCYRRNGPAEKEDDPGLNPEINMGTGSMEREKWAKVVDIFSDTLKKFRFMGRKLDIRENIKFKGGNFPKWAHRTYPDSGCAIAIEFKKIFMDEWTGELYEGVMKQLKEALLASVKPVLQALKKL